MKITGSTTMSQLELRLLAFGLTISATIISGPTLRWSITVMSGDRTATCEAHDFAVAIDGAIVQWCRDEADRLITGYYGDRARGRS